MKEFYGDETRWFIGIVVDGSPPAGLEGSVRIRIHGIHSGNVNDIPQVDLPWAQVVIPGTEGGVSGIGRSAQLLPGAQVFGIFMDGKDSQVPLVLGSIAKDEYPSTVQSTGRNDPAANLYSYDVRSQRTQAVYPQVLQDIENTSNRRLQARTIAMKFFIDNGYNVDQAAGLVGAIDVVSSFDPTFQRDNGFGLVKWDLNSIRYANLKLYARRVRSDQDWLNFELQLLFILQELRTDQAAAQSKILAASTITDPDRPGLRGRGSAAAVVRYYLPTKTRQTTSLSAVETAAQAAYQVSVTQL